MDLEDICGTKRALTITLLLGIDGIQFSLVLNGGKVNYQPQSAHITLECDSSQNANVCL